MGLDTPPPFLHTDCLHTVEVGVREVVMPLSPPSPQQLSSPSVLGMLLGRERYMFIKSLLSAGPVI